MEEFNEIEKSNKKSKKLNIIIIVLILLIVIALGTSYAQWNYNFIGNLTSSIQTDSMELKFLEGQDDIINVTNALPLTDEEGKTVESFNFAVTSKTKKNTSIGYTLSVQKLEADTGYTFLDDSDMKIYLEDYEGNTLLEPTNISELDNYRFYSTIHEHSTSNETIQDKYRLRVWIDDKKKNEAKNWDTSTKIQYKFKINVGSEEVNNPITVTFDANGGTTPVASKKVSANGLYGELPTPTRSGYTFKGWNGKNILNTNVPESLPSNTNSDLGTKRMFTPNTYIKGLAFDNYYSPSNVSSISIQNNSISFVASFGYGLGYPLHLNFINNYVLTYNGVSTADFSSSVMFYKADGSLINTIRTYTEGDSIRGFQIPDETYFLVITFVTSGSNATASVTNIQLEEGTTATPYEPYYLTPSTKVVQTSNHTLKAIWEQSS